MSLPNLSSPLHDTARNNFSLALVAELVVQDGTLRLVVFTVSDLNFIINFVREVVRPVAFS